MIFRGAEGTLPQPRKSRQITPSHAKSRQNTTLEVTTSKVDNLSKKLFQLEKFAFEQFVRVFFQTRPSEVKKRTLAEVKNHAKSRQVTPNHPKSRLNQGRVPSAPL